MNPAKAIPTDARAEDHDLELARRCARGDEQALRLLFVAHEPSLRRLIYRVVGNLEDAEDLSAETFIKFWRTASRYRGDGSLRAYLARIALNLSRDRLRKRKPSSECEANAEPEMTSNPKNQERELTIRIRSAMLLMSTEDRELLTMYYLDDWTYDEICETLDVKYEVLRTRLVRARKRLRAQLGVEDE